jgi:hypothetical protein
LLGGIFFDPLGCPVTYGPEDNRWVSLRFYSKARANERRKAEGRRKEKAYRNAH